VSNHPNRGWRGRWEFVGRDLRHKPTGLVVRFTRAPDDPAAWDGEPLNLSEVSQLMIAEIGLDAASKKLQRLMREAGELFQPS
jgi:hypothetical protein